MPRSETKTYLVGMFVDPVGAMDMPPEKEMDYMETMFKEWFPKNKFEFKRMCHPGDAHTVDIYIIDFGGLMPGCDGLIHFTYDELVKQVRDRPNVLFIMWTKFTEIYYKDAINVLFDEERKMGNVLFKNRGWDDDNTFVKDVNQWINPGKEGK